MTIEQDALRYQWIKAQTNISLAFTDNWCLKDMNGEKYWPTHYLKVNGFKFEGKEHLDDELIDQAMKLYPITDSTL